METLALLRDLSEAVGVAGAEGNAAQAAMQALSPFGPCQLTPLGSVICTVAPAPQGAPHLLLDAHLDEIGLIVTAVLEGGFLRVAACGGVDRRILAASQVTVHARGGRDPLLGVICSTPPHLQGEDKKALPKVEDFYIDTGLTKEAAQARVIPGDRVTLCAPFTALQNNLVRGRALDDRAGCAALIRAAALLEGERPPCGVTVALTTMEEVAGGGAGTAAFLCAPTHAIVVDVSFGGQPESPKHKTSPLGSGAMVGFAPVLNGEMSRRLLALAEEKGIPHTTEVMGGKTGTNADAIAASRGGVKTGLVSIPQRNMHTTAEIVDTQDIEAVAQLLAAFAREGLADAGKEGGF